MRLALLIIVGVASSCIVQIQGISKRGLKDLVKGSKVIKIIENWKNAIAKLPKCVKEKKAMFQKITEEKADQHLESLGKGKNTGKNGLALGGIAFKFVMHVINYIKAAVICAVEAFKEKILDTLCSGGKHLFNVLPEKWCKKETRQITNVKEFISTVKCSADVDLLDLKCVESFGEALNKSMDGKAAEFSKGNPETLLKLIKKAKAALDECHPFQLIQLCQKSWEETKKECGKFADEFKAQEKGCDSVTAILNGKEKLVAGTSLILVAGLFGVATTAIVGSF